MLRVTGVTEESPFRAAGTFTGTSYVERGADRALRQEIQANQRYPYIVAARQSGKSSVLVRTMEALDKASFRVALVDLSTFALTDYGEFWKRFLAQIARGAQIEPTDIDPEQPDDTFLAWLGRFPERLVVFVDEIDALLGAPFRDLFFSKVRSLFNQRATDKDLRRLQFVLAGATHPTRLIQDHMRSPFNVGVEIELDDLSLEHLRAIAAHLEASGAAVDSEVAARIHQVTSGSVYLCQLVLEQLWNAAGGKPRIGPEDVEAVVEDLVKGAPRNVHFGNIYELVANNRRLLDELKKLSEGQEIPERSRQDLRLAGLSNGRAPFRNEVYRRVFGEGGSLDLLKLTRAAPAPALTSSLPPIAAPAPAMPPPPGGMAPAPIAPRPGMASAPPTRASAVPSAFTPEYPDEETRALSEQLEAARERKKALETAGFASEGVQREIVDLRQKLREGGQLRPGDALGDGRYLLIKQVGRGGFATVWQAHDRERNEQVAIKVLHSELAADRSRRERFFRGARMLESLGHRAVVRVVSAHGEDGGYAYYVMEFVGGGDLKQAVAARRLDRAQILRILASVSEALAAAHARGMVHRDIKPSNILLDMEGEPRLTDFDLIMVPETSGGTRTGALGTFLYAAPEVLHNAQDATAAADVFGLGMTLLYCLWGKELPLDAVRDPGTLIDALTCGSPVKDVLRKALAWEPDQRFKDAAEFGTALTEATEGRGEEKSSPAIGALRPTLVSGSAATEMAAPHAPETLARREKLFTSRWTLAAAAVLMVGTSYLALHGGMTQNPGNAEGDTSVAPSVASTGETVGHLSAAAGVPPLATAEGKSTTSSSSAGRAGVAAGAPIKLPGAPGDGCPLYMVSIRGGAVSTGPNPEERGEGDGPSRSVRLEPFCIDRTEVTVAQYRACVEQGGCPAPEASASVLCNGEKADGAQPINCVTWPEAANYCAWANKELPTEAQWVHAARGEDRRRYPWGESLDDPGRRLNACDERCARLVTLLGGTVTPLRAGADDGWETTAPVGSYPEGASPFGVLDMAGNVAEWPQEGGVVLGGSWRDSDPAELTVSAWSNALPDEASPTIGFRCARPVQSTDSPRGLPSAPSP